VGKICGEQVSKVQHHIPVLSQEVLLYINAENKKMIVDGTLGDGGHAESILKNTNCRILGIDRDASALTRAKKRLASFGDRVIYVHGNYSDIKNILQTERIMKVDGFLMDLGVSSPQINVPERGFSFMREGPLDMRMNKEDKTTAADLLAKSTDAELEYIIKTYGEERFHRKVVRAIRRAQGKNPLTTTLQLSQAISDAIPASRQDVIHPATRTFQALRIAVNNELEHLKTALRNSLEVLNEGGRLLVISFHSLEDRIVKHFFRIEEASCVCPPRVPICVCGKKKTLRILTPRPVTPSRKETLDNPRASSAKLRAAERLYV
jgi:16S rRNA (cytosine1402-N4)-methyltransferase